MAKTFQLCLLLLFVIIIKCFSQTGPISVKTLTVDDGLSQGSNYFRFEDRKGFMWITGNDALNRYDGSTVKVYNLNHFFKNCPMLQQGYGFAEDENNLFVGSTRGLYIYDYNMDVFSLVDIYKNTAKTKTAIPIGYVDGKIWCFNEDWQLASYDTKTKASKIEKRLPLKPIGSVHIYANENTIFYFRMPFIDNHGNICIIDNNNIIVYQTNSKTIRNPILGQFTGNTDFSSAAYDPTADKLYIGTRNAGILTLENNYTIAKTIYVTKSHITSIAVAKDRIVFKVGDQSLNICNKAFTNIQTLKKYNTAFQYGFDKADRLWVCRDGYGQVIFDFKERILKNSNNISDGKIRFKSGVGYFSELPGGRVFIQSNYILNPNMGSFQILKEPPVERTFNDFYRNGIWRIQGNRSVNKKIFLEFLDMDLHKQYSITVDIRNRGRLLHLASLPGNNPLLSYPDGLYWLNINKKKVEKINSLPGNNPFYINVLSGNRVAISYLNGDMLLVAKNNNNSFRILQKILPGVQCFYIQENVKAGVYWVGTNEGVYLLNKNFKPVKKFDSNNGLAGTYVYGILIDNAGNPWCSHQRGLSSINGKTFQIINFDKTDNIQEWDFNNRSFFKTSDGTLFFGGVNGFNYVTPPIVLQSVYKPEIYFDELLINGKRYTPPQGINHIKKLHLGFKENDISLKVLVKDLLYGAKRDLYYRITGKDWRKINAQTPLTFSSLAPGNYEITLGYADKFNPRINIQKKIILIIATPFYRTIWFWAVMSIIITGCVIGAIVNTRYKIQLRNLKQQLLLDEQRNKITADLHDDIGASLSSLQINAAIAHQLMDKNRLKDASEILKNIEHQSGKLSENIGDIVWSLQPQNEALMTLGTRIRNFTNEILGGSNIVYHIYIDDVINEKITDFSIKKNIVLIVKEALNNAAKYSRATEISISVIKYQNNLLLNVKDNGKGFDKGNATGNGLHNMKKRSAEIGGVFELYTSPTSGTSISVKLPIP